MDLHGLGGLMNHIGFLHNPTYHNNMIATTQWEKKTVIATEEIKPIVVLQALCFIKYIGVSYIIMEGNSLQIFRAF